MQATELVATAAAKWLKARFADVPAVERSRLRELFRTDAGAPDYDKVHDAFAAEFLLVNFWKCAAALKDARPTPSAVVVDIGCGSGASAAAALAYLVEAGLPAVRLHLVDRSEQQLVLAKELLGILAGELGIDGKPYPLEIDATCGRWPIGQPATVDESALVLASHVLTENQPQAPGFLGRAADIAGPSGSVLVIERGDDPLWSAVDALVAESVLARRTGWQDVTAETADGDKRSWATRWVALERSAHPHCEKAVRGYLTAWRKRDPKLLANVFTERAQYWDKPFHPVIDGLQGIQEYWRKEVTERQNVTVAVRSVAYRRDGAHLEWRATLDDGRDTVKVVCGFMVIEVDPDGKIRELRECYRSQEEARDPAVRSRSGDRRDA